MQKQHLLKKVFFLLLSFFVLTITNAQTGLNFQGVARNSNNVILASQQISLRLSILQGSTTGTAEYTETRTVTTNAQGLFTAVIGDAGATSTLGSFTTINWKNTPKYLKIEMDAAAGSNFITMGTTQFQYVAYAQFANSVDAANIAGIVPVEKGGTGVASITALKTALAIDKTTVGLANVDNTTDLLKPISTASQTALNLKLTKTDTSYLLQKADTITLSNRIDLKINAAEVSTILATKVEKFVGKDLSTNDYTNAEKTKLASITGTNTGDQDLSSYATITALSLKANTVDVNASISIKEDVSNKSTATDLGGTSPSDILYPTQKAVKDFVAANAASGGIADGGISTIKIADLAVTDAKLATGISKSKVGLGNVENTSLSTWTGSNNISSVGTINSGTWSGATIDIAHGGTGATTKNFVDLTTNQTITGSKTFSSTVSATGFVSATGYGTLTGTSAQFLKANGTVDETTYVNKDAETISIGINAGKDNQGLNSIAIGISAGVLSQTANAIAIGAFAGSNDQAVNSIAIGNQAGYDNQGSNAIAIGHEAGGDGQGSHSIAIGTAAGIQSQGPNSIILNATGNPLNTPTSTSSGFFVAPIQPATTTNTLYYDPFTNEISYGAAASASVAAAGTLTGTTLNPTIVSSSLTSVGTLIAGSVPYSLLSGTVPTWNQNTTGNSATSTTAGNITATTNNTLTSLSNLTEVGTITTGVWSGTSIDIAHGGTGSTTKNFVDLTTNQTITGSKTFSSTVSATGFVSATGYGTLTGTSAQFLKANGTLDGTTYLNKETTKIAIGSNAGSGQGNEAISIGVYAGTVNQANAAIAIGSSAGSENQSASSIAMGFSAGNFSQGDASIGIGANAGSTNQGYRSIAIGLNAGNNAQGANSIAIGTSAGISSQAANSIILNATGDPLNNPTSTSSGFFVAPIQSATTTNPIYYNPTTKEISYGAEANAGTLTGRTLNPTIVSSSLTSVGTINSGIWNGTEIAVANGGTGLTTYGDPGQVLTSTAGGTLAWTTVSSGTHTIGETYGGGIVFYTYDGGKHGLIAATADQSIGIRWYGGTYTDTRAKADGIGAGLKNTAIIIANQVPVDGNSYAATVCNEYSVEVDGVTYGDWYLPSKYELNLLYLQKSIVGGFSNASYWSSKEQIDVFAWCQSFNTGVKTYDSKYKTFYVRAIRSF